jgi:MFS family permease
VSDSYGRRPALLIGLAASAAAYIVFGIADSVWLLFASRIIQGAGGGTTGVAQAYVADTIEPEKRARALGWLSAATSAGVMVGPAIGSFAAHFGREAPGFVAAALCLVNVAFAWKWLPESRTPGDHYAAAARRSAWAAAWSVMRQKDSAVPRLIWIYSVGMLGFSALTSVLSLYLGARFSFTEKTIGYVFLYVGLLSLVIRSILLGPVVERIGETWAMRVGTVTLTLGLAVYPLAHNLWILGAIIPLVPLGTALLFPSTTALMSRASDKTELGVTMGVAQTYAGVARMTAPVIATYVFQRFGHAMPFYVAAVIVALVGILAFRSAPVACQA